MKYKVGDRVVYRRGEFYGNRELDGMVGCVIGIDGTAAPYTVEFDETVPDAAEDTRFGGKKGHVWHCAEDHLQFVKKNDNEDNEKENGNMTANITKWNKEMDDTLVCMKGEGKSASEIAAALGITESAVYSRTKVMKKSGRISAPSKVFDKPSQSDNASTSAELNDLESAMAETITELRSENDELQGKLRVCEEALADATRGICESEERCSVLAKLDEDLRSELADAKATLESTETQLDEALALYNSKEEELSRVNEQLDIERRKYEGDTEIIYKYKRQIEDLRELICKKDTRIASLETKLERAERVAIGITDRYLEVEN